MHQQPDGFALSSHLNITSTLPAHGIMQRLTGTEPLLRAAALQRDAGIHQRDWLSHQALGQWADEVPWGRRQPR